MRRSEGPMTRAAVLLKREIGGVVFFITYFPFENPLPGQPLCELFVFILNKSGPASPEQQFELDSKKIRDAPILVSELISSICTSIGTRPNVPVPKTLWCNLHQYIMNGRTSHCKESHAF